MKLFEVGDRKIKAVLMGLIALSGGLLAGLVAMLVRPEITGSLIGLYGAYATAAGGIVGYYFKVNVDSKKTAAAAPQDVS